MGVSNLTQYIRLNEKNEVVKCFSSDDEQPLKTDIEAHGVYTKALDSHGILLYKYIDGEFVMKTPEEQEIEFSKLPKQLTEIERLRQDQADLMFMLLMAGVLE